MMNNDTLLARATCSVRNGDKQATGWLVSHDGHLLTVGHILGEKEPRDEVEVQFIDDNTPQKARRKAWAYKSEIGLDFAVLKLVDGMPLERKPLPVVLAKEMEPDSKVSVRGYGNTLDYQSPGVAEYIGISFCTNLLKNRMFILRSHELAIEGYSGGAVFSHDLQAVVAIQTQTTTKRTGVASETVLAMPLYRIAQQWKPLTQLARNEKFAEINKLLENNKIEEAEKELSKATTDQRELAQFLYLRSRIAFARRNIRVALAYVDKGLKKDARHMPSLALKIKLLLLDDHHEGGIKAKALAEQSYGLSKSLDQWLSCLKINNMFSNRPWTDSELDAKCPFPTLY